MSPWLTPKTGKARRSRRAVGCEGADATAAAEDYSSLERVAVKFAGSMNAHYPLVVPLGRRLVAAWIAAEDPNVAAPSAIRLDVEPTEPILAAVGSASRGVSGFRESHREAIHARRVARLSGRRNGTVTRYEDVALTALTSVDMDLARRFVARELGPLAAQDDDTQRLAATLRVYLEEHCGPRRAAQRLGVHENTIKGRGRVINELLGRSLRTRRRATRRIAPRSIDQSRQVVWLTSGQPVGAPAGLSRLELWLRVRVPRSEHRVLVRWVDDVALEALVAALEYGLGERRKVARIYGACRQRAAEVVSTAALSAGGLGDVDWIQA